MEDKELIERSPTDKQEGVKASGVAGEPSSEDLKRIVEEVLSLDAAALPGPWWEEIGECAKVRDAADGQVALLSNLAGRNGVLGRRDAGQVANTARMIAQYRMQAPILARALAAATKRLEEREQELAETDTALLYLADNAGRFRGTAYVRTREPAIAAARARLARQQEERR